MPQILTLATAQPARHPNPTTRASGLSYLIFERMDLVTAERFLTDFGLHVVLRTDDALFFRGTGPAPVCHVVRRAAQDRFAGLGLRVPAPADLEALAKLPGASGIERSDWPGGGYRVQLSDPSGFRVDAVYGSTDAVPLPHRSALRVNTVDTVVRVNDTQRPPIAPPDVIRLAHVVLEVADFQATCAWYTRHFGLIPTDIQLLPDDTPAVAFLRLDLGDTPTDHHTVVLAQGFAAIYGHSAYELVDTDAVAMGQRVMREKGWMHAWGIGRHLLGSQIFDYWQDPWGDKHEHYCDGDLFTAEAPTGLHTVSREAMSQWGPLMPPSFTRPRFSWSNLSALIRNLRCSPDLTIAKLRTLAKLFA